ncbi:MAG: PGPGW domain-containing protein [Spirochaetia bacterium]|nr:PGPGW domain-containing protein [Spirochaetia bacterium]
MNQLFIWALANKALLVTVGIISTVSFTGTVFAVPFLINIIPEDYFLKEKKRKSFKTPLSAIMFLILLVIKNIAGIILLFLGIILLFMPGQGLLTIFLSVVLIDFPGKWVLQKKIIHNKKIASAVNWIRRRGGKRELIIP